jgi:hypothetical protein
MMNLIRMIEVRLAALDVNSRQAAEEAGQHLREIGAQAAEAAAGFRQCSTRAAETARTLGWHAIITRRISAQIGKITRR